MAEGSEHLRQVMLTASLSMLFYLFLSKALGYAFHLIFANYFTKEVYGSFIYLFSAGIFLAGTMPNLGAAMGRHLAFHRGESDDGLVELTKSSGLYLFFIISGIYISGAYMAYSLGILPGISQPAHFAFIASVACLGLLANYLSGIMVGYRSPQTSAAFNTFQNGLRVCAIASAVHLAAGLDALMAIYVAAIVIFTLVLIFYTLRRWGVGRGMSVPVMRDIVRFGAFTMFLDTSNNLLNWGDIFIMRWFHGPGSVAVYNIAWLASTVSLIFFMSSLQIFKPVVTEFIGAQRNDRVEHLTGYMLESFVLLFSPVFFSIIIFPGHFLTFFVDESYAAGAQALWILAFGSFFYGMAMLFMDLLAAYDKPQINALNIGIAATINLVLNFMLIPSFGMVGAALATLTSSVTLMLLSFLHVRRFVRLTHSMQRVSKLAIAVVFSAILVWGLSKAFGIWSLPHLLVYCMALAALNMALVIAIKALKHEDIVLFIALLEKFHAPRPVIALADSILSRGIAA